MQRIYSEDPPPFHLYNLAKIDAWLEPHQITKVNLFAITTFSGFKSLTSLTISSTSDAWQRSELIFAKCLHNEYHVLGEVSFSFTYTTFVFRSWPRSIWFFKF